MNKKLYKLTLRGDVYGEKEMLLTEDEYNLIKTLFDDLSEQSQYELLMIQEK